MRTSKRHGQAPVQNNRQVRRVAAHRASRSRGPERFVDRYLPYLLARASHLISGEFHATLQKEGIPVMHWRVLCSLLDTPMSVNELAGIVIAKQPTMSKLLGRMEKQGLIARASDPADGRGVIVSLTSEGERIAGPLVRLAKRHEASVLEPLGAEDAKRLIAILGKLIQQHAR